MQMNKSIPALLLLVFALSSCKIGKIKADKSCVCCLGTYLTIDAARDCLNQNQENTAVSRLFLFAFVNEDLIKNQKLGWSILKDTEVINHAKKNYLLVTLDSRSFPLEKSENERLYEMIESYKNESFFVIVNQALYPISGWTADEKKEIIIDRLKVGNGP